MRELSKKFKAISPSVTLGITAKAKKMKSDGEDIIFFSVGEPDFKTPDYICEEAHKVIDEGKTGYTAASGLPELKEKICEKLSRDQGLVYSKSNITVSNGAKHSIYNALSAIINPEDEIIIFSPYWVSYPEMIKMAGGVPVIIETKEENGFRVIKEELESAITNNTKGIIINSPNNPTGMIYPFEDLKMIGDICKENDLYIIADEIYEKLIYDGKHESIASIDEDLKTRTILINGMSKCYAMTGWRIGYAAANEEITKMMSNVQSHATSNPNTIAQYASIKALEGGEDILLEMKKSFLNRRDLMVELIGGMKKVSCKKPNGAFYIMMNIEELIGALYEGEKIENDIKLAEILLEKCKVAVIPGSGFGANGFLRFSYATSVDNIKEGMNRISTFISKIN